MTRRRGTAEVCKARNFLQALACSCLLLLSATACGAGTPANGIVATSWDDVVAKAEAEGTVTFSSGHSEQTMAQLADAFKRAYPKISVQYAHASTGDLTARLDMEAQTGTGFADVVSATRTALFTDPAQKRGFQKPVGPRLAEVPDLKVEATNSFVFEAGVFGWAWNTSALPNGIKSWNDFTSPALSGGRIGVMDPSLSQVFPGCYTLAAQANGPGFLPALGQQRPVLQPSVATLENSLASGEIVATFFATPNVLKLKSRGAPVEFAKAPTASCGTPQSIAIPRTAPHPYAAQVFVNWMLTKDAQAILADSGFAPVVHGIPGVVADLSDVTEVPNLSKQQTDAFTASFNQLFGRR